MLVRHVPEEGEDHEAREETGQRIDGAGDDGVSGSLKSNEMERKQTLQNANVRIQSVISRHTVNINVIDKLVN